MEMMLVKAALLSTLFLATGTEADLRGVAAVRRQQRRKMRLILLEKSV